MKLFALAAVLFALPSAAAAHEVWIERDSSGPARIYLGEPADVLPEGGDPEFEKLVAPRLLSPVTGPVARRAGFLEVAVAPGDVRAWDDSVFQPWGEAGKRESVVYYARAGRAEPRATMPLEIAPVSANGDRFTVIRDGKPVAGAKVLVVSPDKWTRTLVANDAGMVAVPGREAGRYLLSVSIRDEGDHATPGGPVAVLHRIATTTFVR
ncbi:DUF4198 domain-containing protein [Sphingomonas sp.]|uniref:DUF4198 domain-containing protein n=1 Tax=Sphingomonas sp. TaxID=28214 RepID=UPI002D14058B|nr:DUF4198 domain-containing protein [Sphingomonas sp.]HTG38023.1 DUF4198 domain-containing protein [Sphingomonas sp.]